MHAAITPIWASPLALEVSHLVDSCCCTCDPQVLEMSHLRDACCYHSDLDIAPGLGGESPVTCMLLAIQALALQALAPQLLALQALARQLVLKVSHA